MCGPSPRVRGNLRQRLDTHTVGNDESGDMARWINSFIDRLDAVVGQVVKASHTVGVTNQMMLGVARMPASLRLTWPRPCIR